MNSPFPRRLESSVKEMNDAEAIFFFLYSRYLRFNNKIKG